MTERGGRVVLLHWAIVKIQATRSRGEKHEKAVASCFALDGSPTGRPWPPKASGVIYRHPGVLGWRLVWPWCTLVAYRPWSGQGAAVVPRAGRRLFGAVVVPLGQPTAPAMATRPTGALAKAACGLGVVWDRVSGM